MSRSARRATSLQFAQIAEPSREFLPAYRRIRSHIISTADRINRRYGTGSYRPIVLLEAHHDAANVYRFLRAADVCYIGSLHDGMNLVPREFACARDDHKGVLILSTFAGAARELTTALVVNPYAVDACAQAVAEALTMPEGEQAFRLRAIRSVVARSNTYRWAGEMLADATRIRRRTECSHARTSARPVYARRGGTPRMYRSGGAGV
jgi:trehalose-6-phosphate synthase